MRLDAGNMVWDTETIYSEFPSGAEQPVVAVVPEEIILVAAAPAGLVDETIWNDALFASGTSSSTQTNHNGEYIARAVDVNDTQTKIITSIISYHGVSWDYEYTRYQREFVNFQWRPISAGGRACITNWPHTRFIQHETETGVLRPGFDNILQFETDYAEFIDGSETRCGGSYVHTSYATDLVKGLCGYTHTYFPFDDWSGEKIQIQDYNQLSAEFVTLLNDFKAAASKNPQFSRTIHRQTGTDSLLCFRFKRRSD